MADDRGMCELHHKMRHMAQLTRYQDHEGIAHWRCNPQYECKQPTQRFDDQIHQATPYAQQGQVPALMMALQAQPDTYGQAAWHGGVPPYFANVGWSGAALDPMAAQAVNMAGLAGMGSVGMDGIAQMNGSVRCAHHGKQRSANAVEWNAHLNGWVCRTGMQCKASLASGPHVQESAPESNDLCVLHQKRRNRAFLRTLPDGSVQCQEGNSCRVSTQQPGMQ
jgi:hypothetical protein